MRLYFNTNQSKLIQSFLESKLNEMQVPYESLGNHEIELPQDSSREEIGKIKDELKDFGFEFIDHPKKVLTQRIKDCIQLWMENQDQFHSIKISSFLSDKLQHNYSYLSSIFSETAHISIEHYIILKKIELVKELYVNRSFTLTEISYLLNYSSVSHLSTQFKKTVGLTPKEYKNYIILRK